MPHCADRQSDNILPKINLRTIKQMLTFDVSNVIRQYDCIVWRQDNPKNLGR
jgi:hypothetical protein